LGVLGVITCFLRDPRLRVGIGCLAFAAAATFCVQIARLLSDTRGMSFSEVVGAGPFVSGFAGFVLAGSALFRAPLRLPPASPSFDTQGVVFRPPRRTARWFVAAVGVALLGTTVFVIAHGTGDSTSSRTSPFAGASTDPCTIVPAADATKLFGMAAHRSGLPMPTHGCMWTAAGKAGAAELAPGVAHFSLSVGVYPPSVLKTQGMNGDKIWGLIRPTPARAIDDLSGVGDKAKIATVGSSGLEIEFLKDGNAMTLTYSVQSTGAPTHPKASDYRKELVALARSVADRV